MDRIFSLISAQQESWQAACRTQVTVFVLDIVAHMPLTSLYGISIAQTVFYYRNYPDDNRILKTLVSFEVNRVSAEVLTENAIGRHSDVRDTVNVASFQTSILSL